MPLQRRPALVQHLAENRTLLPAQGEGFLARFQIPHLDGAVLLCRGQPLAVARERQAEYLTLMPAQAEGFLARLQVPYLDGPTPIPRDQPLAVKVWDLEA